MTQLSHPLMSNNITRSDLDAVIEFLKGEPILTQSRKVREFEAEWSKWLGVKHTVYVNSGSSANFATFAAFRELYGTGEVIVPPLTWVSDVACLLHLGFTPVFVDIDPKSLAMNEKAILSKITPKTKAVFLTHILGFNGLTESLLGALNSRKIPLIEDACESHGATLNGRKVGSFGLVSNFSCYYAHHLTTIEGGLICTDNSEFYEACQMIRGHGMVRETQNPATKDRYKRDFSDLNPDFIFAFPGFNFRNTEIGAVMGLNQLPRLDENNKKRTVNFQRFLDGLDKNRFRTDFLMEGSSNYAFVLVMREKDETLRDRLETRMREAGVEFRRGLSGGGNQTRQPYVRKWLPSVNPTDFPETEHVHFFGYYIGNYPDLSPRMIDDLCKLVNSA